MPGRVPIMSLQRTLAAAVSITLRYISGSNVQDYSTGSV